MAEIEYVTAWGREDEKQADDARAFWRSMQVMSPEEVERRVKELCSMAYADGKLVGVTTVKMTYYPILRAKFAFYRCAVSADFRRHYLATFLTRHTLSTMEAWSLEHPEAEIQGIAAILQAWELGSKAVYPQWADFNIHMNLAGFTNTDDQVRVAWFRHAKMEVKGSPG